MAQVGRPVQQTLHPENPVEEQILRKSPLYGQNERITLAQLQMRAAWNDLSTLNIMESQWPTKEVHTTSTVQHALPGSSDLKTDTTTRITRVNMTPQEALAHFAQQYDLTAKDILGALPGEIKQAIKTNRHKNAPKAVAKKKKATPSKSNKKQVEKG